MKREIWPEKYEQPDWMYSLQDGIRPSHCLNRLWLGSCAALFLFGSFHAAGDGDDDARYLNPKTVLLVAYVGSALSFFAALVIGEPHGELFQKWLKEKARADSFAREWSDGDLLEIERNAE